MYNTPTRSSLVKDTHGPWPCVSTSLVALETSVQSLEYMSAAQGRYFKGFEAERLAVLKTFIAYDDGRYEKRIRRLSMCCYAPRVMRTESGEPVLVPGRCRDRMCPRCSRVNANQCGRKLTDIITKMNTRRVITFTLAHKPERLVDAINRLMESWKNVRRSNEWKNRVFGGVYSLEVTFNLKTKTWHPHLHLVYDGKYFDQKMLSDLWQRVTGDSPVVYIQAIHNVEKVAHYVGKYCTKPHEVSTWPGEVMIEYIEAIRGRRLFHTFGTFHNVKCDDDQEKVVEAKGTGYAPISRLIWGFTQNFPDCVELFAYLSYAPKQWRIAFGVCVDAKPDDHDEVGDIRLDVLAQLLDDASRVVRPGYEPPPDRPEDNQLMFF